MPTEILFVVCVVVWHDTKRNTLDKITEVIFISHPSTTTRLIHASQLLSSIDFSHHDIYAAENYHYIGNGVAKTKILENGQINETWRTHPIAIRVRPTIA